VALPHPELWNTNPGAAQVFNFGMSYAGSLHILFGAATMLLFGLICIGYKKTLIFFACSTIISLSMELLSTSTGFPFGAYAYSDFLGFKIANLVPYSIPLSWFYMGFTSIILASIIVARSRLRSRTAWTLAIGVYLLVVWDLVLDPAMANPSLPLHLWVWDETGPYFGMPIGNLIGWAATGLIFMGLSRLFWHTNLSTQRIPIWLPCGMYSANIGFAIVLNISIGLWLPPLIAVILGLLPAALVRYLHTNIRGQQAIEITGTSETVKTTKIAETNSSIARRISQMVVRQGSWVLARHNIKVTVEGLEYVPSSGPVVIVARHFHHFYDGCVLLRTIPRPLHILVALDWLQHRWMRGMMEWLCALVDWPVILRTEWLNKPTDRSSLQTKDSAYSSHEAKSYLRHAVEDAIQLLRRGEVLLVFPEGYPNIDPTFTPKHDNDAFLPFTPGFAKLAQMAERDGHTQVAIVPAGLTYTRKERWDITLRFGPPFRLADYSNCNCNCHFTQLVQAVEQCVHQLSTQPLDTASTYTEKAIQP
jgi:putative membrane protein